MHSESPLMSKCRARVPLGHCTNTIRVNCATKVTKCGLQILRSVAPKG